MKIFSRFLQTSTRAFVVRAFIFQWLVTLCVLMAAENTRQVERAPQKPQAPSLRVKTDLVRVRAEFVDSHGKRITNLKAGDIVLEDDGEVQDLSTFQAPTNPEAKSGGLSDKRSGGEGTRSTPQDLQEQEVLILLPGMGFTD